MKQHIRRSHPDAWKLLKSAEDACTSATLGPQPCSYCGVDLKQSARRGHLSRCAVIFQLSLASLQLPKASTDVSGRSHGASRHHLGGSAAEGLLSEPGGHPNGNDGARVDSGVPSKQAGRQVGKDESGQRPSRSGSQEILVKGLVAASPARRTTR